MAVSCISHIDGAADAKAAFSNDEGYDALRNRVVEARKTIASIHETEGLRKAIDRSVLANASKGAIESIKDRFMAIAGDVALKFNVASSSAVSAKKQRLLPMSCTVYDLVNMATELTSHHRSLFAGNRAINAWVGSTISGEYDLEGCDFDVPSPREFYFGN